MQLSNAIRQRILNLAELKNLKLIELAKAADVSYSTLISFMVVQTKTLTLNTLFNLCCGFNIDLVDFFDDELFRDVVDEHEKNIKF